MSEKKKKFFKIFKNILIDISFILF